jgi:hypothetical protein
MKSLRVGIPAALNLSNPSPVDLCGIPVLLVASHHTAFAADALGHVEVKSVLLTFFESALRNLQHDRFNRGRTARLACAGQAILRRK